MLQTYTANSDCQITLDLVNEEGLAIEAASYVFTLSDQEGTEVGTGSASVSANAVELTVTVPASDNTLTAGERLGGRMLDVLVTDITGDTHRLTRSYLLRGQVLLSVPGESGQTYLQALMQTQSMPPRLMEDFNFSTDEEREAALLEAWARLSSIAFDPFREDEEPDPTLPESVKTLSFAVNDLTKDQWDLLPKHFRTALRRAQVIEAAILLGGDPTWENRQNGLISKTVGESSEMFRSKPPVPSAVSPKARREIAAYINSTIRIGRA